MDPLKDIIEQIELHSIDGIRLCFKNGLSPNTSFRGQPLIFELTSEYSRSPFFRDCVKAFVDYGLEFEDRALLSVLLDDAPNLEQILKNDPGALDNKYTLRCAYTPLIEASLLHICAEFNHTQCANLLLHYGLSVDTPAGYDQYGFGGQTPIFHTVNQNSNQSAEMMDLLLANHADLQVTVPGLIWGSGYDWETLIPAVNPISYAMMGLLPQMHRKEATITQVVSKLIKHSYGIDYRASNLPNKYLSGKN